MILKKGKDRFWEIDFLRGFAIILMIFFHILYDLNFFSITNFRIYSGIILYIARLSASIFVILAGISLSISYSKSKNWLKTNDIILKFIKRGLKILFLGMIISVITWFYIPRGFVVFGILHFIGISIILSLIFIRYRVINIIFRSDHQCYYMVLYSPGFCRFWNTSFYWDLNYSFINIYTL